MERSALLTPDVILLSARTCLGNSEVRLLEHQVVPASDEVIGFNGDHWKVVVSVASAEGTEHRLHFFVKVMPECSSNEVYSANVQKREVNFYSTILPSLRKRAPSLNTCLPQCYLSQERLIIFEDLSLFEYKSLKARTLMDKEHCLLVLQSLARFHALSVIFEEKETASVGIPCSIGRIWKEEINQDFDGFLIEELIDGWMLAGVKAVETLIQLIPSIKDDPNICNVVRSNRQELCRRFLKLRKPSEKHRNVVCHGDLWANNILFQYSEGKPVSVKFVDFQLIRYSPPAYDVMSFLHLTTTREFRKHNLDNLLRSYHESLSEELLLCSLDANCCGLSMDSFMKSCREHMEDARLVAINYHPQVLIPGNTLKRLLPTPEMVDRFLNVDRCEEVRYAFEEDQEYRERVSEVVEEFVQYCLPSLSSDLTYL